VYIKYGYVVKSTDMLTGNKVNKQTQDLGEGMWGVRG
jgi:hypothetical protein